jgi:hypothetical protein
MMCCRRVGNRDENEVANLQDSMTYNNVDC